MADEREFPDVEFVDTDTETIANELVEQYETAAGRSLGEADPVYLLTMWAAAILSQERSLMNIAAKRNLPRYAEGDYLDSLAEIFYNVERQAATPANVTLCFTLSEAQDEDVTIPEGTEATADLELLFATTEDLVIAAGDLSGEVTAECDTDGTAGNGIKVGKITYLVDQIAYVASVTNTTVSAGGADEETDDELYERMKESYEAYSTAGTVGAYEYHAKTYNAAVADVKVTSPSEGEVLVVILLDDGAIPDEDTLADMEEYLSSDEIRPLTDHVTVQAPETVPFTVDLTYYTSTATDESTGSVESAVEEAVENYITWQTAALSRNINPSKLIQLVMDAGAESVEVTSPVYTQVDDDSVAQLSGEASITYGGDQE
ncbi:MAG: baseplate J/gp47 family protein [Clostridiales bacterium]|nr:baseplate J/gp47 family protein [Clostridiales bacterium]